MLEIAVLGAGRIGRIHAGNIAGHPQARLAGIADTVSEVAARLAATLGARVLSVEDAFGADAVLIASPTSTHADYIERAAARGRPMFCEKPIKNYRDWLNIDSELWRHYWFAMVNRGVMAQPYWWDEQWTISVAHTDADIDQHLAAFAEVAPMLAAAQKEPREKSTAAH